MLMMAGMENLAMSRFMELAPRILGILSLSFVRDSDDLWLRVSTSTRAWRLKGRRNHWQKQKQPSEACGCRNWVGFYYWHTSCRAGQNSGICRFLLPLWQTF
jgi:hypothetical protein